MSLKLTYDIVGKRNAVGISDRDRQMLEFLWRHRVATFRTLHTLFYDPIKPRTCYNRLNKLRKKGFVQTKGLDGLYQHKYWCLDKRGMAYLIQVKGEIFKTMGFAPQSLAHDHFASCVLLGDWYKKLPAGASIITEQELLSLDLSSVISGFQNESKRRPDGLWKFNIGSEKTFVALEVELHAKSDNDYIEIIRSYDSHFSIEKIIWVVEGAWLVKKIFNLVHKHSNLKPNDHLFLLAGEVKKDLWLAQIKNEELKKVTLGEYLSSFCYLLKNPPSNDLSNAISNRHGMIRECVPTQVLFNFKTVPAKSATYKRSQEPPSS